MYDLITQGDMPISVSALRDHCRIVDDSFDSQLTRSWYAAVYDIERRTQLLLRPCTVRVTLRGGLAVQGFVLPVGPADRGSVVITDGDGASVEGWYVNPNTAEPVICIEDMTNFEEDVTYYIDFSAGYVSIPADLNIACLELAAHHFENREATAPIQLHAVPNSVWSILASYGRPGI